ncbi:hypothetical protein [Bradyrhizobium sp. CCBAU 11434]|uniref:hypothetical protein n=1 Tax=Bradyrhizobium sp. CCBAU 11434 TaxID=1630885 RepID=UPI0023058325|nr:hypothetical protein [Bradyrhizobium sp. CCBAU 11434]
MAPTSLMVDGTYQRDLSERSIRLIRRTIETFRWNRYKPPIAVQTGPATLHVIDGQHTAIIAATLKIPEILILIVGAESVDERARAFVGHNLDRIKVTPFDIYRALLASGDEDAVDVDNVCKRAGVRIRVISPSSAIAEGDTAALGLVRRLVKKRGVVPARKVLQCLVKAKRAPITGAEILASEYILCEERKNIDLDALTAAMRIEGTDGLLRAHAKAKTEGQPIFREVANRWLRRIDRSHDA